MTDNITIPRATVKQALDALERALETSMRQALKARIPECGEFAGIAQDVDWAATALTAALEQQQAEPVASIYVTLDGDREFDDWKHELPVGRNFLYTAPPQRKPLTDEEIEQAQRDVWRRPPSDFDYTTSSWIELGIRYAEAAHGIKEGT